MQTQSESQLSLFLSVSLSLSSWKSPTFHIAESTQIPPHMLFPLLWTVWMRFHGKKAWGGPNTAECQESYLDVVDYTLELLNTVLEDLENTC